ncbi:MAG TPA: ArsR family transcriptional regulator, partial [Limnochordia bacterium]
MHVHIGMHGFDLRPWGRGGAVSDLVKLFKALGDDNRLRILAELRGRSLCVCDLARRIGLS